MGKMSNAYKIWSENEKGRNYVVQPGIDRRRMLKLILEE
jgi:hypothetical protein